MVVALLIAGLAPPSLMFQSHNVSSQWDTWAFLENGTYYVYYLVTEHSPGEGFGVATSADGQHWIDHGYVFHGPSWSQHRWWEGTGSVWRAPDYATSGRYLINWSQDPGHFQNITFGESFDLIHWTPLDVYFDIDTRYYNLPGRWDCIYTIPVTPSSAITPGSRDGYPRYGFWTASPKRGTMGFGITHDGVAWEALPSPTMVPPLGGEVGAVEYIRYGPGLSKGGYYALLGTGGHMLTYNASDPAGPYHAAVKNVEVLPGCHSTYFARFFWSAQGELLVTHQTFSHEGRTYVSPFKRAFVDDAGTLRFGWWAQNEALKGDELPPLAPRGSPLSPTNRSAGAMIEATLQLPPPPSASAAATATAPAPEDAALLPGFVLETVGGGAVLATVGSDGRVSLSTVANASRPANATAVEWGIFDRSLDLAPGAKVAVRLLCRRDMLELYLNDYLFPVYLMPATTGRLGVLPVASALVSGARLWQMSLPGEAPLARRGRLEQ